jgi:unsaturated chondroitin disaccharide hydrolase
VDWVERALQRCLDRVESTATAVGEKFPYFANPHTGEWLATEGSEWCGGHWVCALWYASLHRGRDDLRELGFRLTQKLLEYQDQDDMFRSAMYFFSCVRGWELLGDERLRAYALAVAPKVAEMFNPRARQFPVGHQVRVRGASDEGGGQTRWGTHGSFISAVDNIYISLLLPWWAWRQTGDPWYRDICAAHADRAVEWFMRPDGSTWEFIDFHPETGAPLGRWTLLGYSADSTWARGQAWFIHGLVMAYEYTRDKRYLDALERATDFLMRHRAPTGVPWWDLTDPNIPDVPVDTSAAAVAAAGLVRLAQYKDEDARLPGLAAAGVELTRCVVEGYLTPLGEQDRRPPGMVLAGCFNRNARVGDNHELFWGDFYLLEALRSLRASGAAQEFPTD